METDNQKLKVLVAEDDREWRELVTLYLEAEGYEVLTAADSLEAFSLYQAAKPDVLVLDVSMPHTDGLSLARKIREIDRQVYIIFMSGLESPDNEIAGYNAGAGHFFRKPFDIRTLTAFLRSREFSAQIRFGSCVFVPATRKLSVCGVSHTLSRNHAIILGELCREPGVLVSRKSLLIAVQGHAHSDSRTVDAHVSSLRKLLAGDPSVRIKSCYNGGYQLIIES